MSIQTIKAQLKKGYAPEFLIECDFGGFYDRIAQRDISFSDRQFKGLLLNNITYSTTFNFDKFQYNIGSVSIRRNNPDRFQDQETRHRLDGGICTIYLWCQGLAWSDISTDGIIFKGTFEKIEHGVDVFQYRINDFSKNDKKSLLPKLTINDDNWPLHRKAGGAGSVSGNPYPLVFGDFPGGVKLQCVDWYTDFLYLVMSGVSKSVDADFTATTENIKNKDGVTINAGNYALEHTVDSLGNPCTVINMTGDYAASEPLSCSIQAVVDGSGEYTGTAGTLIDHPADILSYLTDIFGGTGSYMDTGTLKSMKVKYPSIKMATSITEQSNLDTMAQQIMSQLNCAVLPRIGGGHGLMIFDPSRGSSGHIIQDHSQVGNKSTFKKTAERLLCNNLTVQYSLNHSTGHYEKEITRNKENDPDCLQSYLQYKFDHKKIITLPDIYDDATAELIVNNYITVFAFRHDTLDRPVFYHDGYGFQEGDVIEITDTDGPSTDGAGWVNEKCILIQKKYQKNTINQTLWRIAT